MLVRLKGYSPNIRKGLSRFLKPQSEDGVPQLSCRFLPGRSSEVLIIVASDEPCCTGSHVKPAKQDYFFVPLTMLRLMVRSDGLV